MGFFSTFKGNASIYSFMQQGEDFPFNLSKYLLRTKNTKPGQNSQLQSMWKVIYLTNLVTKESERIYYDTSVGNFIFIYNDGVIDTRWGLKVIFDGDNLMVSIPDDMVGMTEGLCGNSDMDPSNDLTTTEGVQATDVNTFANSWKVYDSDRPK